MTQEEERDIEKTYPHREFAAKLRRLADALEAGEPFEIQVAGERIYVPTDAEISIEHERGEDGEELEFQLKWNLDASEDEESEDDEESETEGED